MLPELVAVPWRKLRQATSTGSAANPPTSELHQVRIRAKRARYAAEAAAAAIPAAAPHAAAIAELQGVLGDQHDAVVAEEWLRDAVAGGASRQQALRGRAARGGRARRGRGRRRSGGAVEGRGPEAARRGWATMADRSDDVPAGQR